MLRLATFAAMALALCAGAIATSFGRERSLDFASTLHASTEDTRPAPVVAAVSMPSSTREPVRAVESRAGTDPAVSTEPQQAFGMVIGSITDSTGRLLPRAGLVLAAGSDLRSRQLQFRSDEQGLFTLDRVPVGTWEVWRSASLM